MSRPGPEVEHGWPARPQEDERSVVAYAPVVWRHRVLVAGLILVALLGTFGLTLMMARVYKARVTLIAPKEGPGGLLTGLTTSGVLHSSPGSRSPLWRRTGTC